MLPPRPMVMAGNGGETTVAPTPRSPPKYPDICGRRRLQLEVQILNRELGFLEEEVQSLEGLQPVSRCCKEVNEFVGTNSDPLVPINKKRCKSCHFWRSLGSKLGSCLSCIFCCTSCSCQCKKPKCYNCCPQPRNLCSCCFNCKFHCNCFRCSCPKLSCCHLPRPFCCCYNKPSCCGSCPRCCSWNCSCCSCHEISCCKMPKCCCPPTISCPEYSCGCVFDCPKCTEVHLCPRCTKPCCVTGCLC